MATAANVVCFILLSIYSHIPFAENVDNSNLLFVQMIWRHGDRSPLNLYPTDPNPKDSWPEGFGELTLLGKKQHYGVGTVLRKMYDGFITSSPREVKVQSSDAKRCLESAMSNLAAFFAPTDQWKFESSLNWQPIPIHYIPAETDKVLRIDSYCPAAIEEGARMVNSPAGQAANEYYSEMFKYYSEHSGSDIKDWVSASELFDTLKTERKYNMIVPTWADKYWDDLSNVTDETMYWSFHSPVVLRLKAGPLIEDMLKNIENKINNKLGEQKVQVYSAHDINLAALMQALQMFNMVQPPFCATFIVELYQVDTDHMVRFLYLNSSTPETADQNPNVFILEGCTEYCPLQFFLDYANPLIPDDWEAECNAD